MSYIIFILFVYLFNFFFFFNDTATTEIYTLSLHDALPIFTRLYEDQDPAVSGRRPDECRGPRRVPARPGELDLDPQGRRLPAPRRCARRRDGRDPRPRTRPRRRQRTSRRHVRGHARRLCRLPGRLRDIRVPLHDVTADHLPSARTIPAMADASRRDA